MSSSDSPFSTELPLAAKFSESAESHFSAVSKEKRVRVEASKKRLTTMRPRSAGTFLIARWPIERIDSAVSSRSVISSGVSDSIPSRSLERRLATVTGMGLSRIQTSSAPSVSWNITWMTSRLAVGTLLPT